MNSLEKNQVALIESDVESARITLTNLSHELVDHICCEVENLMGKGMSFEEAYGQVKSVTGIEVLQKINENTICLIDQKYATMKTTMKITGNVSLVLLAIGTVLKIFHWPGAGISLIMGFFLLATCFFPLLLYFNYRDQKEKRKMITYVFMLIGGTAFISGILFKVMHWPGAGILLLSGWGIILLFFLPMLLISRLKESPDKKEKRVYLLGAFALFIFEAATMFKFFHWPGAGMLLLVGSVLLVSVFLPSYAYLRFRQSEKISGEFIFLVIISMYAVVMTALLSLPLAKPIVELAATQQL